RSLPSTRPHAGTRKSCRSRDLASVASLSPSSPRREAGAFRGLRVYERKIQLRQRIELRGSRAGIFGLGLIALALVRLADAIQVVSVLLARLLQLGERCVPLLR